RVVEKIGIPAEFFHLARMLEKREQSTRCCVARRFVASDDEEEQVREQLERRNLLSVELSGCKDCDDVFARLPAALFDELGVILEQRETRALVGLLGGFPFPTILGIGCSDDLVGPAEHELPVRTRHPEKVGEN